MHNPTEPERLPIVVHSHLRWDFVWQRPQQILTRLATDHRIAFVEEPMHANGPPRLEVSEPYRNIVRIVPMLPDGGDADADAARTLPLLRDALGEHVFRGGAQRAIHWFYTPMAAFFLGKVDASAVVYDCMDELSKFRFAPADIAQRESVLLAAADVVFTGSYQLFTSKSAQHRNVHFYGCGVDVAHFRQARKQETPLPPDVASLAHPVLGYFGVIDERLDYELIDNLACRFGTGSIVMIGPVVKVEAATLPRRPNIHWLGQRDYQELPAYVKAFDVCLMPFALNEATENINPTKTLEYMAAGKPIVSTAVRDVMRNFTPIVEIAQSRNDFVALAHKACAAPHGEMIASGIERANAASWDALVAAMRGHMLSAVRAKQATTMPSLTT